MQILKILKGKYAGRSYELTQDEILIGRDAGCDLVLCDATVSRRHARIVRRADGLYVEDLGSRNGTYLNGLRIESAARLKNGDRIRIHEGLLTFHDGAASHNESAPEPSRTSSSQMKSESPQQPDVVVEDSDENVRPSEILMAIDATSAGESRIGLHAESKLQAVLEITRNLGSSLALADVLPNVLESVLRIFPQADRAYVLRAESPDGPFVPVAIQHRQETGDGPATVRPISSTIARQVLALGQAILSADSSHDERFVSSTSVFDCEIRSMMCAPLIGPSRIPLGIIYLDTTDLERPFGSEDLDVLVSVAVLAGQAMEYARQHQAQFQAVVEAALDCIITIDRDGRIVEFNTAAERTFGYSREEAVGRELAELIIPPRFRDAHRQAMARLREAAAERLSSAAHDRPSSNGSPAPSRDSGAAPPLSKGGLGGGESLQASAPPPAPPYEGGESADVVALGERIELVAMRRDGEEFTAELSLVRIPVHGPPMFTGYLRDITDRKQYEDRLRALNETLEQRVAERTRMLRLLHEVATAANEARSPEQAMRFAIERVCSYWGWRIGHVYWVEDGGRALAPSEIWHGAGELEFDCFREVTMQTRLAVGEGLPGRVLETGKARWIENVLDDPDWARGRSDDLRVRAGIACPVLVEKEVVAVLEFYSEDTLRPAQRFLEVMDDIGAQLGRVIERRRADRALRESEERFRAVFHNAAVGVVLADPAGRIVAVNPALERMLGYPAEELVDKRFAEITHPDDLFRGIRGYQRLLAGQTDEYETERRYLCRDGRELWAHISISAVRDLQGGVLHTISMIQDVTDRKRLEREMADAALREQRRLGQELHDGVGQELTGLGFLARSLCQTLQAQGRPESERATGLASGLQQALGQVRAIARGLVPVEIDAEGLRSALHEFALNTAKRYGICCEFCCDRSVRVEDSHIATQLFRIAQEAVNNAVKHGRPRRIDIGLDCDERSIALSVADDGVGIGPESEKSDGTGMRIMRHRAGVIGATLDVRRSSQGGTVVTCTLD